MNYLLRLSGFSLVVLLMVLAVSGVRGGVIESYQFETPEQQQRFFLLNETLRCPQCQNQSIADSNAPIAEDLRREVHRLIVEEGADDESVIQFMLDRYGDFVLYRPLFDARTLILWLGPLTLLLLGLLMLVRILRRHRPLESAGSLAEDERKSLDKILDGND